MLFGDQPKLSRAGALLKIGGLVSVVSDFAFYSERATIDRAADFSSL
jgi:hypothetical protein